MKKLILYITLSLLLFSCEKEEEWNRLDTGFPIAILRDQEIDSDTDILLECRKFGSFPFMLTAVYIEDLEKRKFWDLSLGEIKIGEYGLQYDSSRSFYYEKVSSDSTLKYKLKNDEEYYRRKLESTSTISSKIGKKEIWGFSGNEVQGIKEFYQEFYTRTSPEIIIDTVKTRSRYVVLKNEDFKVRWKPYNPIDSIIIGIDGLKIWKKIPDTGEFVFKREFIEESPTVVNHTLYLLKIDKKVYFVDGRKIIFLSSSESLHSFMFAEW